MPACLPHLLLSNKLRTCILPHAEPASGMVGFAHAALGLGGAFSLGITHLRFLNPYVITSMKVAGER